jgi:hypothetical protein
MSNSTGDGGASGPLGSVYIFNTLVIFAVLVITAMGYRHIYSLMDPSEGVANMI